MTTQPIDIMPQGGPNGVLDLTRPFWVLSGKYEDPDTVRQDGYIYGWSDSNVQYELIGQANAGTASGAFKTYEMSPELKARVADIVVEVNGRHAKPDPAGEPTLIDYSSITRAFS